MENENLYLGKISKIKPNHKNIIKIAEFLKNNFVQYDHPFEYKFYPYESLNIYKIIEIYGYGNCKHYSILFKFFMELIGVKCSMIYGEYSLKKVRKGIKKENHVFNIIELNKKKYLIDTDFGIIKYNNNLIEYQNSLNKEIFSYFYSKRKKFYSSYNTHFINLYNKKFTQDFNISNNIFDYKKKLGKYFSDLYFVQIPFFNKKFKEKKVSKNILIIRNKIIKQKSIYNGNVVDFYSTKFLVDDFFFTINNFPYLIVDIKVISNERSARFKTFKLMVNNKKYEYEFNKYIFKNRKLILNPMYSFIIESKKKINYVEIEYQKSSFKKKLTKFINQITK